MSALTGGCLRGSVRFEAIEAETLEKYKDYTE